MEAAFLAAVAALRILLDRHVPLRLLLLGMIRADLGTVGEVRRLVELQNLLLAKPVVGLLPPLDLILGELV